MKALEKVLRSIRESGEKALVPFFTAGYPDEETFVRLLKEAAGCGCRLVEVGIPFSDPMADGPEIQESSRVVLANGMTLKKALALTAKASEDTKTGFIIMSYVNPLMKMGFDHFSRTASASGVTGLIVPDLPLEESAEVRGPVGENGLTLVDFVAPTSGAVRIGRIAAVAEGFLYLISLTGVTGARTELSAHLGDLVASVRKETDLPLLVGFGVSTPEQAAGVTRHADGVIIGSAITRMIRSSHSADAAVESVGRFLKEVKRSIERPEGGVQS